jgi:phosphate transport system ATP-binding protein
MFEPDIRATAPIELEARDLSVLLRRRGREVDQHPVPDRVVAFIGPSGCGKSTLLRCFNRMNDLVPARASRARRCSRARNLYGPGVDPVDVRRRIGMVFQKPNPFPKSIYDNVAFGRASTATAATWTSWSSGRCGRPRCGTRSRTG